MIIKCHSPVLQSVSTGQRIHSASPQHRCSTRKISSPIRHLASIVRRKYPGKDRQTHQGYPLNQAMVIQSVQVREKIRDLNKTEPKPTLNKISSILQQQNRLELQSNPKLGLNVIQAQLSPRCLRTARMPYRLPLNTKRVVPKTVCNESRSLRKRSEERHKKKINQAKPINFKQFVFWMSFAHNVYPSIITKPKFKAFVGRGNNANLVKSIIKKRFWWEIVDDPSNADFIWTQKKQCNILSQINKQPKTSQPVSYSAENGQSKKSTFLQGVYGWCSGNLLNRYDSKIFNFSQIELSKKSWDDKVKRLIKRKNLCKAGPSLLIHNHFPNNFYIGNKKALYYLLTHFYQEIGVQRFENIPCTFHIVNGSTDPQFLRFRSVFEINQHHCKSNIWIIKPGQNTNRGNGIRVMRSLQQITKIINSKEKHSNGQHKTYILQLYISKPLLYKGRKFDIRHFLLITSLYGKLRAYWSYDGYVRTSSLEFQLDSLDDRLIHLTNDAVQKFSQSYGKFQPANKLSYQQLNRYLQQKFPKDLNILGRILPRMKQQALDAVKACSGLLDPQKGEHLFQLFGLDFIIDQNFNPFLIQINTNPCLETPCPLLQRIIPLVLQNSIRLSLDIVQSPRDLSDTHRNSVPDSVMQHVRFQLIFDMEDQQNDLITRSMRLLTEQLERQHFQQQSDSQEGK